MKYSGKMGDGMKKEAGSQQQGIARREPRGSGKMQNEVNGKL